MAAWDVIVIGLGGVGSAAAYHLADSGLRVLGIDQFERVHAYGSSHGKTRVIRQAYFEHPAYVPMLLRAYQLWDNLQQRTGRTLFHRTGLIEIGPPDGVVIPGVEQSAREHQLDVERYSMSEVHSRWPGLCGHSDWVALLERNAGFLEVERCVDAHLTLAERAGAVCRHRLAVLDWRIAGSDVTVRTADGEETAAHVVIASGGWTGPLVGLRELQLKVLRKHQYWFEADDSLYSADSGCPCFFYETDHGYFYGFPSLGKSGVKLARHSGGEPVDSPSHRTDIDPLDQHAVLEFAAGQLPAVTDRLIQQTPCYYTMTADEHFIIDRHPEHPQVILIGGLSGHGFKFTSVLGEMACRLVRDDPILFDTNLYRLDRLLAGGSED